MNERCNSIESSRPGSSQVLLRSTRPAPQVALHLLHLGRGTNVGGGGLREFGRFPIKFKLVLTELTVDIKEKCAWFGSSFKSMIQCASYIIKVHCSPVNEAGT